MLWSSLVTIVIVVIHSNAASLETKLNLFEPVLSSNAYVGRMLENERVVQLQPRLYASDADLPNSVNGQICGYELSLYKHDDLIDDEDSQSIPFTIDIIQQQAVLQLKPNINKIDCEVKQFYRLFVRAYDCANKAERRYSERSVITINIDDVNEFAPVFTHEHYFFKLHQDQDCLACRVEATDDDCSNIENRVCTYQIQTPNVPFSIDSNGLISITNPLATGTYEFDVIAVDCYSLDNNTKMISKPAKVTIKVVKSCKPAITDSNPTKLTVQIDHAHIFETAHIDTCEETCAVEYIRGTVTLDSNDIDSGCISEQCMTTNREYTLIPKDADFNQAPKTHFMSFNGISNAIIVEKDEFSGEFKNEFSIRMWMKHEDDKAYKKEHIFCKSDGKLNNRHHAALLLHQGYLKLVLRKGPLLSTDKNNYISQWLWKLSQINDNQWHSYKLFINYPKVDLYVDDQLIVPTGENFETTDSPALTTIEGTDGTKFVVGACWFARGSTMAQHFQGQLSGLIIEQKEEITTAESCIQNCQQYIDLPDIEIQSGMDISSNSNRSLWTIRADSSESYENLLKHIVYRNTFEPIGPPGQRTVSVQTTLKCLGENATHDLPTFTRRISIDEVIIPANVELRGDTNFLVSEQVANEGLIIFQNVSIKTDAMKDDLVDITDCSINTIPELTDNEQLIIPDENFDVNNLQKDHTQTGIILSGLGSIDSYHNILRRILFVSKSPIEYPDRTFSLACVAAHDQTSTNEIRVKIHIEKQAPRSAPGAAALSNKLYVDNDQIRDTLFDIGESIRTPKGLSGWPIVVVVCVSIGLASVLVLYLVVRIRSGSRQRGPLAGTADDAHSQMEWEDDIGLNIIVNPLDAPKNTVQPMDVHNIKHVMQTYEGMSSDEDEYEDRSNNEYSSDQDGDEYDEYDEDEDEEKNRINSKKDDHQLEWDDESMEYGPRKV